LQILLCAQRTMRASFRYASVPIYAPEVLSDVPLDLPEVLSDGMVQPENQRRRHAVAVSLVLLGIAAMIVVPNKLSIVRLVGKEAHDEWIKLVDNTSSAANKSANGSGNWSQTGSAKGSANGSADESALFATGSANESSNGSANNSAIGSHNAATTLSTSGSFNLSAQCSGDWDGCLHSKCCVSEGHRCYKKNDQWAQCRRNCTPGIDRIDQHIGKHVLPWSCDDWDLTPKKCAGPWEGCLKSKCCKEPKQRCFKKNDHWAQCRDSCRPGLDERDKQMGKHLGNWSCENFDDTPLPANCSADEAENCWTTRCCTNPESKCFKKDAGWAACNATCTEAINPGDQPLVRTAALSSWPRCAVLAW